MAPSFEPRALNSMRFTFLLVFISFTNALNNFKSPLGPSLLILHRTILNLKKNFVNNFHHQKLCNQEQLQLFEKMKMIHEFLLIRLELYLKDDLTERSDTNFDHHH